MVIFRSRMMSMKIIVAANILPATTSRKGYAGNAPRQSPICRGSAPVPGRSDVERAGDFRIFSNLRAEVRCCARGRAHSVNCGAQSVEMENFLERRGDG